MPIVARPEDIRLPKRKLRKDPLYKLGLEEGKQIGLEKGKQIGLEEGKQIGLEEGFLKALQDTVFTLIWEKIELVPKGVEVKKLTNSWNVFELFDRKAL